MKVAILGANGFVGFRLFERWQKPGPFQARAIVRNPTGLARIARFRGDWRLADARDERALIAALEGCEAIVHCVSGDERVIASTVDPVYRAAVTAGVSKLIYLSSAAVHGQNPSPGTTEASPLRDDHLLAYNNAKVKAERRLAKLARRREVATVVLRPGIVFGAGSRWIVEVADAISAGRAYWIDGGQGVCNSIHVDNLAHAVECALVQDGIHGETFLVGDAEAVTWRGFYLGIAAALGCDQAVFAEAIPAIVTGRTWTQRIGALKATDVAQRILAWFPGRTKETVKAAMARWNAPPPVDPWALPSPPSRPCASLEMTLLFACRTKLSHAKAAAQLGYRPPVSFAEGVHRSAQWLAAVGYRSGN